MADRLRTTWALCCVLVTAALSACGDDSGPVSPPPPATPPTIEETALGTYIGAQPQRVGDATRGYHALVNNAYVSCGVPYSVYSLAYGAAPQSMRLPDRDGKNVEMPYAMTYFTTKAGVELVTANCLTCHADSFNGQ